jgi:hypothetical protein
MNDSVIIAVGTGDLVKTFAVVVCLYRPMIGTKRINIYVRY